MKIAKIITFLIIFVFFLNTNSGYAVIKLKFLKKKQKPQVEKMVETKQQWEDKAKNVPLELRKLEPNYSPKESNKKFYYPKPHFVFEKYNYPQGLREVNIENVKKDLCSYPYMVTDLSFKYVAYSQYYYSPDVNQISSNFFAEELDTTKTRIKRMLEYNHKQKTREPIIEAGSKEIYPNLFNGLSVVDWSHDSKKVLIKEKVGSIFGGIYKTYLYVHIMPNDVESGQTIKLTGFDNTIKQYFENYENTQLVKYRYDIQPLGFSSDDDNIIIALCYVYDKDNNKLFMGTWGYNIKTNETILYSKTDPTFPLSINGLILKETYD